MKAVLISALVFLGFQMAYAQQAPVERELYSCHSDVDGFSEFRVVQINIVENNQSKTTYQMKTGFLMFEEAWNQVGNPQINTDDPIFQGEFSKKVETPVEPTEPGAAAPQTDVEEYFVYVTINKSGSGSLSVDSDLQPINCTRSF